MLTVLGHVTGCDCWIVLASEGRRTRSTAAWELQRPRSKVMHWLQISRPELWRKADSQDAGVKSPSPRVVCNFRSEQYSAE